MEDRRISTKSIAEQLGISRERVGSIIREDLDLLVVCFLPGRAKDLSAPLYSSRGVPAKRNVFVYYEGCSESNAPHFFSHSIIKIAM